MAHLMHHEFENPGAHISLGCIKFLPWGKTLVSFVLKTRGRIGYVGSANDLPNASTMRKHNPSYISMGMKPSEKAPSVRCFISRGTYPERIPLKRFRKKDKEP